LPGTPETPKTDECVEDPGSCLPGREPEEDQRSPEEDRGGSVAPGRGGDEPKGPGGASSGDQRGQVADSEETAEDGLSGEIEETSGTVPGIGSGGALEDLGRGLADATRRFAFPIGIISLVGAFLLLQGRLDRRDPKLAAAPIDSRDDLVVYR
jgi:hypothetical protein